ncbi:MAG: histidine phosphatase family protein [Betaproteobacteria bacterium]|nr:histidine phosphatase family protein [Betaproteobacteria bacterium]
MDLILWRHAEAGYGPPDLERTLTSHGEQQARAMAAWLRPRLPEGTRILASPARRTQQTAAALSKRIETLEALAPGASAEALLAACGWTATGSGSVVVVGHQPTLGEVARRLLGICGAVPVRKGAIWWFTGRDREGSPVVLTACLPPALLND